jgi:hypothetical protein
LVSCICEFSVIVGNTTDSLVFAVGILVGVVAFKQDWDTQAAEAEGFMGGQS